MFRHRHRAAFLGIAAMALFAGVVLLVSRGAPPGAVFVRGRQDVTAPNGTVIHYYGASYGKEHVFHRRLTAMDALNGLWCLMRFRPLPKPPSRSTGEDCLVVWLWQEDAVGGRAVRPLPSIPIDEHGCAFDERIQLWGMSKENIDGAELHVFPRRSGSFRLQFYQSPRRGGRETPACSLTVPSVVKGPYPRWVPGALPATQRAGDLEITLSGLPVVWDWRGGYVWRRRPSARPAFRVTRAGRPAPEWMIDRVVFSDATGNELPIEHEDLNQDWRLAGLCWHESAWKLRVRAVRRPTATFAPDETWRLPAVAVPAAGSAAPLTGTTTRKGVSLRVMGICAAGEVDYGNGVPHWKGSFSGGWWADFGSGTAGSVSADSLHVDVRVSGLRGNQRLGLLTTDQLGRPIANHDWNAVTTAAYSDHCFLLDPPPAGAKKVTLTFIVQTGREVEFLVAPPKVPPDPSPGK